MLKKLSYLLLFVALSANAQDYNWKFNRLSISHGLSNTMVFDVIQDSTGHIWVATANGLNRFNAYEIQVFQHDPDKEGTLPSNIIPAVYEDTKGRIWVGTNKGLCAYNKQSGKFKWYEPDENDERSAPLSVQRIVEDKNGNLWLGTGSEHVVAFDPDKEVFFKRLQGPFGEQERMIRGLTIDHEDNLWIAYNGTGASKYNIGNDEHTYYHQSLDGRISDNITYVMSIYTSEAGDVWLGCFVGGLAKYSPEEDNFTFMENPYFQDNRTKTGVQAIGEDEYGNIIVGANGGGVFIFDPVTEKFLTNFQFNALNQESISDDFIIEIYKDNAGIQWFGTENGGVFYYNPIEGKFKSYKKEGTSEKDLPGVIINAIYAESNSIVWVGTENNGVAKLDRSTGQYHQYRVPNVHRDKGNTFVNAIVGDQNGGVWIGAEMGGITHMNAEGKIMGQYGASKGGVVPNVLPSHDILCMLMDSDSTLWAGSYRGFFEFDGVRSVSYCVNPEDSLCANSVMNITDFDEDWLTVCYSGAGLKFFNKKTKTFGSQFEAREGDSNSLPNNWIYTSLKDSKGRFWVGSPKGLSLMNNADSSFFTYGIKEGLPDGEVMGILEDHTGHLWISTAYGLSLFDPEEETFKNYFEQDGLQSSVFRPKAYYKSRAGEMYFGGPNGFNSFYPYELQDNPYLPNVVFTDFKIFNKSVVPGKESPLSVLIERTKVIELDYTQDVFSFEFAALNYTVPEKNEYAYMLEGFDKDWNYIGTRRFVSFTSIPAGEYTLRVKASNNDGLWNEVGTEIKIIIHPPFWKTWWFRSLVVLSIGLIIFLIYKRRVRSIERQNKLLEEEVVVRTKQVVEQKDEIEKQKELVEEKNKDMMDSIRYSKRIQDSFLPDINDIKSHFEDGFVMFRPKDIVSGDFFWYENVHDKIFLAVADCTGHGVPGAMVSVLGNNGLHRSIKDNGHEEPGVILDDLTDYVVKSLEKKGDVVRDGMDIALCSIDLKTGALKYAGANNPLWINRGGEILEYKATKQPIGKYADRKSFVTEEIQLEKGDWIFMFSDGFPDQFGGPKGKKYKYATLKKTLLNYKVTDKESFENHLNRVFDDWKGSLDQIDDVCIMGVKY